LLVLFVSLRRLVLRLLYTILLFMGPRYLAILFYCSMVILGGAFSTHLLGKERNRKRGTEREKQKAQGRGDSKVKWVEYERKVKSVNAKKGWSRS
jgi:hypothetical protein